MGEMSITYEELFELLRRERNSDELQTLDPDFYPSLVNYFQEKKKVLEDQSEEAEVFGSSEKENVEVQLGNAKKIARELIERRQKKIVILALNKARTESDIIDTSALLEVEKEFFHESAELFSSYREGVQENIAEMKKPAFKGVVSEAESTTSTDEDVDFEPEEPETSPEEPEEREKPAEESEAGGEETEGSEDEDTGEESKGSGGGETEVTVKFNSHIPKFMGKNEEVYGPYEEDETAALEPEIAQILIKKGRAEQV